ncbi:hypothetical protein FACS1894184_01000 [Clostridia bacterium]|nr:hypothetical protein FACS1894184_01000 [Clostridia bacterium]
MRSNNCVIRVFAVTLILILMSASAAPAFATAQPSYGVYAVYGTVATVYQTVPLYQDSNFTLTLDNVQANAEAIVIDWVGDSVKVYIPAAKRAGWLSRYNLQISSKRLNLAVVCSQSVSIRQSASVSSTQLASAANGQALDVLDVQGEWFNVRYVDPTTKREYIGWLRSDFVVYQPDWIVAHKLIDVYAMPQYGSNRVAQVAKGTSLMILGEMNGYLCVNLRNASGFVNARDVQ